MKQITIIFGFTLSIALGLYHASNATTASVLPLGTVTNVVSSSCTPPNGAALGAACFRAIVRCRNTDDINVAWALKQVTNQLGLIALTGPDPSNAYFGGPNAAGPFAARYNSDGFSTAQIAWVDSTKGSTNYLNVNSGGGSYPGSAMIAACRQATITKYIYDTYDATGIVPFGQQGHSEGSGAVLYTIVDYGLGNITKAAMLSASSPSGDYYGACTNAQGTKLPVGTNTSATSIFQPCSDSSLSKAFLSPRAGLFPDTWNDTTTCQGPNRTPPVPYNPTDLLIWQNASLANENVGSLSFPTRLSHFECPGWDGAPAGGVKFYNEVPTMNIRMTACGLETTTVSPAAEPYCTGPGKPASCCSANGQGYCYCTQASPGGEAYWSYKTLAGFQATGPGFNEMVKQFENDLIAPP
jgi:hypothetical protein